METLKAINRRASLKSFISSKDIEPEKIRQVLEAGRLAPSAENAQPWYFLVVKGKKNVQKLVDETFNLGVNAIAREAPAILIVFANPAVGRVIHGRPYYPFDVGMAVENMLVAATDLGLVTHIMTNLNEDALKKFLGVPDEITFMVATPLAYPNTSAIDEAVRKRRQTERIKKELKEIVYWDRWGNVAKAL